MPSTLDSASSMPPTALKDKAWISDVHEARDELSSIVARFIAERSAAGFAWVERHYERGLDWVLARRFATLMVAIATFAATVLLYLAITRFQQQHAARRQSRSQR